MTPFQRVCDALGVTPRGREVRCPCPAHGGDGKNLVVRENADGKVLLWCHSRQCSRDSILAAIGLTWRDLLPDYTGSRHGKPKRASKPTDFWTREKIGDEEVFVKWDPVCTYPYVAESGELVYEKVRYRPAGEHRAAMEAKGRTKTFAFVRYTPNKQVIWGLNGGWHVFNPKRRRWEYLSSLVDHRVDEKPPESPDAEWFDAPPRVLYDLPMLAADLRDGAKEIWVCEGEPDAIVFRRESGLPATTADAGAGTWRREYTEFLARFARVVIVADNDAAGMKGAIRKRDQLAAFDPAPGIRVVKPGHGKDVEAFLLSGGTIEGFVEIDPEAELATMDGGGGSGDGNPPPAPPSRDDHGEEPSPPSLAGLFFHDLDLAEAFAAKHGEDLRYCSQFGCWMRWMGTYWAEDENGGAAFLDEWRVFAREQERIAVAALRSDGLKVTRRRQVSSQRDRILSLAGGNAVESLARRIWPIPVTTDQLDQVLDYLPVANGEINLRTGELHPARREHLCTGVIPIAFDPDADCPRWIEFLTQSLADTEMVVYMQMVVGYWLTGLNSEQKFWFLWGPPRSGKGTFIRIIQKLLGRFSVGMHKKFIKKDGPLTSIDEHWARTKGKRILVINEVDSKDRLDEAQLKMVTGEDLLTARRLHEASFDFYATAKMILIGNERPRVRGEDAAFWTRVLPVGFPNSRVGKFQDPELDKTLASELPGILLWAVEGSRRWFESGRLPIPAAVGEDIAEFHRVSDLIGRFLRCCCRPNHGFSIRGQDLFEAYTKYFKKVGFSKPPILNQFGEQMRLRTDVDYHKTNKGTFLFDHELLDEEVWNLDDD